MAQWINFNRNNKSVLAHQYSVMREKFGPILPPLVCLSVERQRGITAILLQY